MRGAGGAEDGMEALRTAEDWGWNRRLLGWKVWILWGIGGLLKEVATPRQSAGGAGVNHKCEQV